MSVAGEQCRLHTKMALPLLAGHGEASHEPLRWTEVASAPHPAAGPPFLQKTLLVATDRHRSVPMGKPLRRDRVCHPDTSSGVCVCEHTRVCACVHLCACACFPPHRAILQHHLGVPHASSVLTLSSWRQRQTPRARPPLRTLVARAGVTRAPAAPSWHSINVLEDSESSELFATGPPRIMRL